MDDYTLFTTSELVNELNKYTSAYTVIFLKRDEDTGPKAIRTNVNCYETAKMQIPGLVIRVHNWVKSLLKQQLQQQQQQQKASEPEPEPTPQVITNEVGKRIISVLKDRTEAGIVAVVFLDGHEIYMSKWESNKGQAIGLATELYERMLG